MSLESVLAISKKCSPELLNEIQNQNIKNLKLLSDGINIYHSQKIKSITAGKCIWQSSGSNLYDYSKCQKGVPIIFIPSLINKASILHLSERHSLMLRLAKLGMRPFLLDWGQPTEEERYYTLDDYALRLFDCIEFMKKRFGQVAVAGYCMGGHLAIAAGCLLPNTVSKIVLIATPWDFNIPEFKKAYALISKILPYIKSESNLISADLIRMLFYYFEPMSVNQKFINLSKGAIDKAEFALIENWVNDGIPMVQNVFHELINNFIGGNDTLYRRWKINQQTIMPEKIECPVLCVIARKDKIAPERACIPLHHELRHSKLLKIDSGHIGMIINQRHNLAECISNFVDGNSL